MMRQHLYRDQIAVCGADGRCFVRNDDAINAFTGSLALSVMHLPTGSVTAVSTTPINLPRGAAAFQWMCLGSGSVGSGCTPLKQVLPTLGCSATGSDCVLVHNLTSATGLIADENFGLLTYPGNLSLPADVSVTVQVTGVVNPDGSAVVNVVASGPALFVHLITLAPGRFSENMLVFTGAGTKTIAFIPFGPLQLDSLTSTVRVEHLGSYA